jgi:hypothetical protein
VRSETQIKQRKLCLQILRRLDKMLLPFLYSLALQLSKHLAQLCTRKANEIPVIVLRRVLNYAATKRKLARNSFNASKGAPLIERKQRHSANASRRLAKRWRCSRVLAHKAVARELALIPSTFWQGGEAYDPKAFNES